MVYFKGAPVDEFVRKSVKQTVQFNYNKNNTAAMKTFDMIQEGLECCGDDAGPKSWYKSTFNDYDFPDSCCRQRGSIECSNNVHIPKQQTPSKQALWEVGCVEKLTNIINSNIFYILGGIAAVAFMEIFGRNCCCSLYG